MRWAVKLALYAELVRAAVSMRDGSPGPNIHAGAQPRDDFGTTGTGTRAAATGWAVNGVADAHATLTQITGGRPRRAFMQAMLDGAVALLHGETVAAGDLFADALTQADGQASDHRHGPSALPVFRACGQAITPGGNWRELFRRDLNDSIRIRSLAEAE